MQHKMKLLEKPFESIENGSKTVEFRLYDEKRKNVKIGDTIEFSKLPDLAEKIEVEVLDLYQEKCFKDLFLKLYEDEKIAIEKADRMQKIYSKEEENKYGVLGIKIKLIG